MKSILYNVAIIDTDFDCLDALAYMLGRNHFVASVACFSRASDYMLELSKAYIDLAFIRIGNSDLQGLYLARNTILTSPCTRLIFMSSSQDYAVMAFEGGAWGYLLLPAVQAELDAVIDNIRHREIGERGDLS